jgi:hypothetical protein
MLLELLSHAPAVLQKPNQANGKASYPRTATFFIEYKQ